MDSYVNWDNKAIKGLHILASLCSSLDCRQILQIFSGKEEKMRIFGAKAVFEHFLPESPIGTVGHQIHLKAFIFCL